MRPIHKVQVMGIFLLAKALHLPHMSQTRLQEPRSGYGHLLAYICTMLYASLVLIIISRWDLTDSLFIRMLSVKSNMHMHRRKTLHNNTVGFPLAVVKSWLPVLLVASQPHIFFNSVHLLVWKWYISRLQPIDRTETLRLSFGPPGLFPSMHISP